MYTAFYGLREKPFALVPDPRYLFLAESHREALAHLLYGIDQAEGFIAVTGEVGTGKTTICRTLLDRLGSETEVAFLFNPSRTGIELLQDICTEFGLESAGLSRSELGAQLNRFLLQKKQEKRRVLLIIDEAQNLSESTLEQVRLLSNLETSSQKLVQILLLGQPELDRKLDSAELRQLRQRISVRWGLHPLGPKETRAYVRHRLHVAAGAERDLFTEGALREIHRRTRGVPRLVNVLCDRVLLAGYVARAPRITAAIVRQAAREIPDAKRSGLLASRQQRAGRAARTAVGRVGAGAVFAAGILLGAAVVGGLFVGSMEVVRERLEPLLSGLPRAEVSEVEMTASLDPVSSPPPSAAVALDPAELRPVAPEKIQEMSEAVDRSLASGDFLGAVLSGEDGDLIRAGALNAVLESFGFEAFEEVPPSDEAALGWLDERGLATLILEDADLETLRQLDHPVLVRLRGVESESRFVALLALDGELAALHGVVGPGPLWVPVDELLQQWDGAAWVVWNDWESIGGVLAFGEHGNPVSWLQQSLGRLGYYDGDPNGFFDRATLEGLQAFQRGHALQADGMAGPRTRMALYRSLEQYPVPHLIVGDEG